MPSISDVYKEIQQVNGRLDTLHADMKQLSTQLQALHTTTATGFGNTVSTLNAGFTAMTQGMQAVIALQTFANDVLQHQARQQDTMICILEHISGNTCRLVTEADQQTRLQQSIEKGVAVQTELLRSAHAETALELDRLAALRLQVEECCPPRPEPPACSYRPCEKSRFDGQPPRVHPPSYEPVVREPHPPG